MFRSGHRLALAGAAALLVIGVLLNSAQVGADVAGSGTADRDGSVLALDTSPVAAVAVVGRVRSPAEAELGSIARFSKTPLWVTLALLSGLVPLTARALWRLSQPERRVAPSLWRSARAALRAPPSLV
jgi:hypothetical protein